jgi:hypothetical protein
MKQCGGLPCRVAQSVGVLLLYSVFLIAFVYDHRRGDNHPPLEHRRGQKDMCLSTPRGQAGYAPGQIVTKSTIVTIYRVKRVYVTVSCSGILLSYRIYSIIRKFFCTRAPRWLSHCARWLTQCARVQKNFLIIEYIR